MLQTPRIPLSDIQLTQASCSVEVPGSRKDSAMIWIHFGKYVSNKYQSRFWKNQQQYGWVILWNPCVAWWTNSSKRLHFAKKSASQLCFQIAPPSKAKSTAFRLDLMDLTPNLQPASNSDWTFLPSAFPDPDTLELKWVQVGSQLDHWATSPFPINHRSPMKFTQRPVLTRPPCKSDGNLLFKCQRCSESFCILHINEFLELDPSKNKTRRSWNTYFDSIDLIKAAICLRMQSDWFPWLEVIFATRLNTYGGELGRPGAIAHPHSANQAATCMTCHLTALKYCSPSE